MRGVRSSCTGGEKVVPKPKQFMPPPRMVMERWSGAAVAVWRHNTSVELLRTVCFVHELLLVSKLCMWPTVRTHTT